MTQRRSHLTRTEYEKRLRAANAEIKRLRARLTHCVCQPRFGPKINAMIDEICEMVTEHAEIVQRECEAAEKKLETENGRGRGT